MDPICASPTNNDVVKETMVRTLTVAKETSQEYAVVTYDLAIARKVYSIQAIEKPAFDKILIMLGNVHTELAHFGVIGTFISDSGIDYVLFESGVLAERSMVGFSEENFTIAASEITKLWLM